MAGEGITASVREASQSANTQQRLLHALTAVFVAGALYATVVAFLWFAADFIAASIYSPNLDQAQQVSDFNDFAYISDMLAKYRFPLGALALIMSVALLVLAVVINDPRQRPRPVFIAGGVALLCLSLLLAQGFSWVFAVLFAATVIALFQATNWPAQSTVSNSAPAAATDEDVALLGPAPDAEPAISADNDAETVAPAETLPDEYDQGATKNPTEAKTSPPIVEPLITPGKDAAVTDEHAMDSLGLDIDSDINLDLEPDYELAHGADTVEDPLVLLSQADLGIDEDDEELLSDDTIETAAKIEAEIGIDVPLEEANTEQIRAMIDAVDGDEEPQEPEMTAAAQPAADNPELAASQTTIPAAVGFDPEELARQESLLPPPRTRVWNLLDWVIVAIIIVAVLALLAMNMGGK